MGFRCWNPFIGSQSDGQFSWVTHLLDDLDRQFSHSQFAAVFDQLVKIADEQRACAQQAASFNSFDLDALQSALAKCGAAASNASCNDQSATREKGNLSNLPSKIWVEPNSSPNKQTVYAEFVLSKVWWASWQIGTLPLYDALSGCFARSPMIERQRKLLRITSDLARVASAYSFLEHVCFVCERPTQDARDEHARFHCETGPALAYKDGCGLYSWHGVTVPERIIRSRHLLTYRQIEAEPNITLRRVMIEQYGTERFILDSGGEEFMTDEFGTLYAKRFPNDEPVVMVRVTNKTKNPDGTYDTYFLRVPPFVRSPREAVAWTFGMAADEYKPAAET
jgi:hypothetical protein